MFIERWSLRGRFRWIVGAGLLALAAYRSETGERRLQDETSDCDSLLPTTIAPYVRSRARPLGQRRTNGKETRRPRRCTLIVAWRCLLKNFVSHQPRRERRLHGTVEALSWRPPPRVPRCLFLVKDRASVLFFARGNKGAEGGCKWARNNSSKLCLRRATKSFLRTNGNGNERNVSTGKRTRSMGTIGAARCGMQIISVAIRLPFFSFLSDFD